MIEHRVESLAQFLEDAARDHRVSIDDAGRVTARPGAANPRDDAQAQLFDLYAAKATDFAARLGAGLPLSVEDQQALSREAELVALSGRDVPAIESLDQTLPELELSDAELRERLRSLRVAEPGAPLAAYFSAPASTLRYRARRAFREGRAIAPEDRDLLHNLIRFEPDLLLQFSQTAEAENAPLLGLAYLANVPTFHGQGYAFYPLVDMCIRARVSGAGEGLASIAADFFQAAGQSFKSLEFAHKAGLLSEQANDIDRAVQHYRRMVEEADGPQLLWGLYRFTSLLKVRERPEAGEVITEALRRNRPGALSRAFKKFLVQTGGGGDWIQNVMKRVLVDALTQLGPDTLEFPTDLIGDPLALTMVLQQVTEKLPEASEVQASALQMTALASEFQNLTASGELFSRFLQQGEQSRIDSAMAYITARFGVPFLRECGLGDLVADRLSKIFIVVTARNVGDSALFIASAVRLAELVSPEVVVLYYASRQPIVDLYWGARNVRFIVMADQLEVPLPLRLCRVGPGSVSAFYAQDWWSGATMSKLVDPSQLDNYLLNKLASLMLSADKLVTAPIELTFSKPSMLRSRASSAAEKFRCLGLTPKRTVLVAPLANALFREETSFARFERFWVDSIAYFRKHGFDVVANARNHGPGGKTEQFFHEVDCQFVDLDLNEAPSFVEQCGYFTSVRSGFCDLIALANPAANSKVVYARDAQIGPGLAHFGISEVVVELKDDLQPAAVFADWVGQAELR